MKSYTVEERISDYHKQMSICRMTFAKGKIKKLFYRCYKNFDKKFFEKSFWYEIYLRQSFLLKVLKVLLAYILKTLHL